VGTSDLQKLLIVHKLLVALFVFGAGTSCSSQSSDSRQTATMSVREFAGVKLRPASGELLDAVEALYSRPVSVVFRDDLGEGIEGYSYTRADGAPIIVIVPGKGQNEENIVHELFHLKMLAEGYPLFDFEMPEAERLAHGQFYHTMRTRIHDPITHFLFYPKMRQMGLDPDANTREQLQRNRFLAEQRQASQEWLAAYFMKVSLETRDPKIQAELEQWYHEKGWIWALEHGRALVRIANSVRDDPESFASIVVNCFNELLSGRAVLSIARVERREYGTTIIKHVIVQVQPRSPKG
jgi:hypothetical protein